MAHGFSQGLPLKKKYGQHFLRDQSVTQHMIDAVQIDSSTSIFEIGCGDGFLTRVIMQTPCARLWVFEIDPHWANYVRDSIRDPRLTMHLENILDLDFNVFQEHKPWTLLANLPYQITFPILHCLQKSRHQIREGVIMVQEEVAQKILKKSGKGYGYPSLFFQRYFEWRLLDKVPPGAFYPPPKVYSRLLYFKPKQDVPEIQNETEFWKFIKACFRQPRRTMRNNMIQTHYDLSKIDPTILELRAQQMKMEDFMRLWELTQAQN